MILPALRAEMGIWRYYISMMTFGEIAKNVDAVQGEMYDSDILSDMLQRSITDNVRNIKEYILAQDERLFNAIILAVYDGDPEWLEMDVDYEGFKTYNIGLLQLSGEEHIFPVDGQHRVEGIKQALVENPGLASERVSVIFIAHDNGKEGKKRTRRLFSTLNRRAKPVQLNDIIALDEDDSIAIATRAMVEDHMLFQGKRLDNTKQRAIHPTNRHAFTSIITLYECNRIIVKNVLLQKELTEKSMREFLLYRPDDETLNLIISNVKMFWDELCKHDPIQSYLCETEDYSIKYRDATGGNLLFRPFALQPFIDAIFESINRVGESLNSILPKFLSLNLMISDAPWKGVLWNPIEKKINTRADKTLIKYLLMYMVDPHLLNNQETGKMLMKYASAINLNEKTNVLDKLNEDIADSTG